MASVVGTHIPVECPVCRDLVDVPVTETGRDGSLITCVIGMGPFRDHIANHKPAGETP